MVLSVHAFPVFDLKALGGTINVVAGSDVCDVMLMTAYTFASTQLSMTAVKAAGTEITGTGYTTGGVALTSVTATLSGFVVTLTCANPSWTTSTISASDAVFYDAHGGTDATNIPIVHWSFGATVSTTAGTFLLTINGSGLKTSTDS